MTAALQSTAASMIIEFFLPNPIGKDTEGEWIKLFNNSNKEVDLSGWQIKDASGKTFTFGNVKIEAGKELVLSYQQTKIYLNNKGETLFLFNKAGELIDQLSFSGSIPEGEIVSRNKKDIWSEIEPTQTQAAVSQAINLPDKHIFNANFLIVGLAMSLILSLLAMALIKKFDK